MQTIAIASTAAVPRVRIHRLFVPSLADCLFAAILAWVFMAGSGWSVLLADGDTGWHIRTGEYILDHRSVPREDLFSFTRAGRPWFAWEWLADVWFALLHRAWGLAGVVAFSGILLSACVALLFRHAVWRGANVLAALCVTLVASGACSVHYLARPHIFTFLGLTVSMWMLDRDLRRPSRSVWWLVPVTAVWTNLHGGFLAWIACLGLVTTGLWLAGARGRRLGRYALLTAACSAATLANPYGFQLHLHALEYLRSPWIRDNIQEFQSPGFRSEGILQFELLMFAALMLTPVLLGGRRFAEALPLVFWAHAALVSVRHVPVFAILAAPVVAAEATRLWDRWTAGVPHRSVAAILRDLLHDLPGASRASPLLPAAVVLALYLTPGQAWPRDFPAQKFPAAAIDGNPDLFQRPGRRILSSDQWGDYLIYRLYPAQKVFIDGRSDFYGPSLGAEYLSLFNVDSRWESVMARYAFDLALLPVDMPLAQVLKQRPEWRVRFDDHRSILFERRLSGTDGLNKMTDSAEVTHGGLRR